MWTISRLIFVLAGVQAGVQADVFNNVAKYQTESRDLHVYISRPDIRPPKFDVNLHSPSAVSSGYWFVSPYGDLADRSPSHVWSPGQIGPHIYDGQGELVWSGAHLVDGERSVFDFKAATCHGTPCMTYILNENAHSHDHQAGSGVVLDASFRIVDAVDTNAGRGTANMHEFTITSQNTALLITYMPQYHKAFQEHNKTVTGWIGNNGFIETDIATGKKVFEWWALDEVSPEESRVKRPQFTGDMTNAWDCFHVNSVDKLPTGDYLVSARHTDCIYLISGVDGSIIWRLGGAKSSFTIQNFAFARQHDARFRWADDNKIVISLFNNAADSFTAIANLSSVLLIELDIQAMTARLLNRWERPDKGLTRLRGNAQFLPNGNLFTCWSENAVISEFDAAGNCVLEAHWRSTRFDTYRAYKFNFTSVPSENPALVVQVYGTSAARSTSAFYVSWNGATEVASWNFYSVERGVKARLLGSAVKTTFETMLMLDGHIQEAIAEAFSRDGCLLGSSAVVQSVIAGGWSIQESDYIVHTSKEQSSSEATNIFENSTASTNPLTTHRQSPEDRFMASFQAESFVAGFISATVMLSFGVVTACAWRRLSSAGSRAGIDQYRLASEEYDRLIIKPQFAYSSESLP